jgi:RimJ/RimL family protein N-acetyltransferase
MSHTIRRFRPTDDEAVLAFTATLPEHDLLFSGRDLRHPRVIEAWQQAVGEGWIDGLVAEDEGRIVASGALIRDPLGWSGHVGEIRLLVAPERRGQGLGSDLLQALLAIAQAHGLAKLTATMTPDATTSVALFERLGFTQEARLAGHVRASDGVAHDLLVLARPTPFG